MQPVRLVVETGEEWWGESEGLPQDVLGEVVFHTGMTGYQEVVTDPSYVGQIVVMTYPLIGNYGVHRNRGESRRPRVAGLIAREICVHPSHAESRESFPAYLRRNGTPYASGFDTRSLARFLARKGTVRGVLTGDLQTPTSELARRAQAWQNDRLPALRVTARRAYRLGEGAKHIVVVDYGVKRSILRRLLADRCRVTVVPATSRRDEILKLRPDGVILSNGPGDPRDAGRFFSELRRLVECVPTFGICFGHQLLCLALGATAYKLPYGHRGGNHPVKCLETGRMMITAQNHGYAVDADSLERQGLRVTHLHLHDESVEGFRHASLPVSGVQFHPEASPGPRDAENLLTSFLKHLDRIEPFEPRDREVSAGVGPQLAT